MKDTQGFALFAVLFGAGILIIGGIYLASSSQTPVNEGELCLPVNASQAIKIVINDSNVSTYISEYFAIADWRVVRATLIHDSLYDLNGNVIQEGNNSWKVELMERSCACGGISDLYVVEGYVSASTGEILKLETKIVSENMYEKTTCASTVCH